MRSRRMRLPGAQVESLSDIAERAGLARRTLRSDWALPPTAVYGTPNNQDNGIPGEAVTASRTSSAGPNTPPAPKQTQSNPAP